MRLLAALQRYHTCFKPAVMNKFTMTEIRTAAAA
jgi:hypothetical protein